MLRSVPWRLARTVRTFYRPTGIFFPELHPGPGTTTDTACTALRPNFARSASNLSHRKLLHRNSAPSELAAPASAPIEASPHRNFPSDRCPFTSETRSSEAPDIHTSPRMRILMTDAIHVDTRSFRSGRHARLFPECKFDNRCQSASETCSFRSGRHAHLLFRMRIPTGRFRG